MAQQLPEDPRNAAETSYIPSITDERSHFPWGRPCLSRKCDSGRQQMALVGLQCQGGSASATACASWWPGIRGRCNQLAEIPNPQPLAGAAMHEINAWQQGELVQSPSRATGTTLTQGRTSCWKRPVQLDQSCSSLKTGIFNSSLFV